MGIAAIDHWSSWLKTWKRPLLSTASGVDKIMYSTDGMGRCERRETRSVHGWKREGRFLPQTRGDRQ